MILEEYGKKRDLAKTPEPSARTKVHGNELRFVVQKHAASHLHYDFRLELDGVLKSWAIPKGPSLDPSVKRLAMLVEDHPYEYRNFEGVIPKGNYGVGTVLIWDEGTYHAPGTNDRESSEKTIREGFSKGDVKFVLEGHKLKGEFALVRIKSAKDNSWLLLKKRDEWATSEDVTLDDKGRSYFQLLQNHLRNGRRPERRSACILCNLPKSSISSTVIWAGRRDALHASLFLPAFDRCTGLGEARPRRMQCVSTKGAQLHHVFRQLDKEEPICFFIPHSPAMSE